MSSLLEEAIVDAKALKEAALKNAETAVLEKYSAEVRGALSSLLEQDELGLGLEETEEPAADMAFTDDVPFAFQTEELDGAQEDELVEIDFDQLKARIAEEEGAGIEAAPEAVMDATEMAPDLALEEGGEENSTFKQMADDEDAAESSTAVTAGGEEEGYLGLKEGEGVDVDITEEMLADLIEELTVDVKPVPQGWSSLGSAYSGIEQANNDAMAAAHDATLEEDEEVADEERTAPDVTGMVYEEKISQLTESTRELRALLIESKEQLTKLNLDNAKLVYQNKALNSSSLNERQKNKIVDAVQSANSVEEASMIYEAIQNAVGTTNSNSSRPQTLREAVTRPTSLLINSKKNNKVTKDPNMDRMLRLAGLTKQ